MNSHELYDLNFREDSENGIQSDKEAISLLLIHNPSVKDVAS